MWGVEGSVGGGGGERGWGWGAGVEGRQPLDPPMIELANDEVRNMFTYHVIIKSIF